MRVSVSIFLSCVGLLFANPQRIVNSGHGIGGGIRPGGGLGVGHVGGHVGLGVSGGGGLGGHGGVGGGHLVGHGGGPLVHSAPVVHSAPIHVDHYDEHPDPFHFEYGVHDDKYYTDFSEVRTG